jgi:HD-like signal output (HDOD) protein
MPTETAPKQSLINVNNLDASPAVLHKLLELTQKEDFDADEAVSLLKSDPGLTARVFKVCSNPEYGRGNPPQSIREAVIRLGARELYRLATMIAMGRLRADETKHYQVDALYFWKRTVATAVSMEEISPESGSREIDYTIGLMHLIGVWILCKQMSADGTAISAPSLPAQAQAEKLRFGIAYAQVGATALERWGFAKEVCEAVCWQNEPEFAEEPAYTAKAQQLKEAIRFTELCLGFGETPTEDSGLEPDTLAKVVRIRTKTDKLMAAIAA